MGCGASTNASAKYEAAPRDEAPLRAEKGGELQGDAKTAYQSRMAARVASKIDTDLVMSFDPAYSPALYELVTTALSKDYKVGPRGVKAVAKARRMVIFLSPTYFGSKDNCAEFCEAVKAGVEVVLVCVEGSVWKDASGNDMPFPSLEDVPAGPARDAASVLFGLTIAIDHKARYLPTFVEKLRQRLGPPAAGGVAAPLAAAAKKGSSEVQFDCFLSHKRSESQDTVARVHDKLVDLGYRAFLDRNDLVELSSLKTAVRDTGLLVAFLTPNYFRSAWCMLEICEAVAHGVPVLFVVVDGATWGGHAFPVATDAELGDPISVKATEGS